MHRYWVQGLIYFWTHDPAVPPAIRAKHAAQGLCKDEWPSNEHFPTQLYVREAARMVGDKVFTYPMREVSLSSLRCCCGFVVIFIH
jgi:protocatechuate 3,4-dioxygenase beta subunit